MHAAAASQLREQQQNDGNDAVKLRTLYAFRQRLQTENKNESQSLADAIAELEAKLSPSGGHPQRRPRSGSRVAVGATRRVAHGHGRNVSRFPATMQKSGKIVVFDNVGREGVGLKLCDENPAAETVQHGNLDRPNPVQTQASATLGDGSAVSAAVRNAEMQSHGQAGGNLVQNSVVDNHVTDSMVERKKDHIFVKSVAAGGPADRHGFIRSGDRVIEINSESVPGRTLDDAKAMLSEAESSGKVVLAIGVLGTPAMLAMRERNLRCKSDTLAGDYTGECVTSTGHHQQHHAHHHGRRRVGGRSDSGYALSDGDDPIFNDFEEGCLPGSVDQWTSSAISPPTVVTVGKAQSGSSVLPATGAGTASVTQKSSSLKRGGETSGILRGLQRRLSTKSRSQQRTVVVDKDPILGYGVEIQGGRGSTLGDIDVMVRRIEPGGPADRTGRLQAGDHIVQINSLATAGMSHDDIVSILRASKGRLELLVEETAVTWAGDSLPSRSATMSMSGKSASPHLSVRSQSEGGDEPSATPGAPDGRAVTLGNNTMRRRRSTDHMYPDTDPMAAFMQPASGQGGNSDAGSNEDDAGPGRKSRLTRTQHLSLLSRRKAHSPRRTQESADGDDKSTRVLGRRLHKFLARSADSLNGDDGDGSPSVPGPASKQPTQVLQAWARSDSSSNSPVPTSSAKRQFVFTETVVLTRTRTLGFTLVGGWLEDNTCLPVCVKRVLPGSAASSDGRVRPGDEIIAANGQNLSGMTLQEAKQAIKKSGVFITLEIRHRPPATERQQFSVSFTCGESLGFVPVMVRDKQDDHCQLYVMRVDSKEAANHLRPGDHLLAINNNSLLCQTAAKIRTIFSELKPPELSLKVERMCRPDLSSSESGIGSIGSVFRASFGLTKTTELNSSAASLDSSTSTSMSTSSVPSSSGEFEPLSAPGSLDSSENPLQLGSVSTSDSEADAREEEDEDEDDATATMADNPDKVDRGVVVDGTHLDLAVESAPWDPLLRQRSPSVEKHRRNSLRFMRSVTQYLRHDYRSQFVTQDVVDGDGYAVPNTVVRIHSTAAAAAAAARGDPQDRLESPADGDWTEDGLSLQNRCMTGDKSSMCSDDTLHGSECDAVSCTSSLVTDCEEHAYDCSAVAKSFQPSASALNRLLGVPHSPGQRDAMFTMAVRMSVPDGATVGLAVQGQREDSGDEVYVVQSIAAGSPAASSAIHVGDVILRVNDVAVSEHDLVTCHGDIVMLVGRQSSGRTLSVGSVGMRRVKRGSARRLSDRSLKTSSPLTQSSIPLATSDWSPDTTSRRRASLAGNSPPGEIKEEDPKAEDETDFSPDVAMTTADPSTTANSETRADDVTTTTTETTAVLQVPRRTAPKRKRRVTANARRLQAADADNDAPASQACMEHRSSIDSVESHDSLCAACLDQRPRSGTATAAMTTPSSPHRSHTMTSSQQDDNAGSGVALPSVPPRSLSLSWQARNPSTSSGESLLSPDSGIVSLRVNATQQARDHHDDKPRRSSSLGRINQYDVRSQTRYSTPDHESPERATPQHYCHDDDDLQPYAKTGIHKFSPVGTATRGGGGAATWNPGVSPQRPRTQDYSSSRDAAKPTFTRHSLSTSALKVTTSNAARSGKQSTTTPMSKLQEQTRLASSIDSGISSAGSLPTFDEYAADPNTFPSPAAGGHHGNAAPRSGMNVVESIYMNTGTESSRQQAPVYQNLATVRTRTRQQRQQQQQQEQDPYSDYEVMQSPRNSSLFAPGAGALSATNTPVLPGMAVSENNESAASAMTSRSGQARPPV